MIFFFLDKNQWQEGQIVTIVVKFLAKTEGNGKTELEMYYSYIPSNMGGEKSLLKGDVKPIDLRVKFLRHPWYLQREMEGKQGTCEKEMCSMFTLFSIQYASHLYHYPKFNCTVLHSLTNFKMQSSLSSTKYYMPLHTIIIAPANDKK